MVCLDSHSNVHWSRIELTSSSVCMVVCLWYTPLAVHVLVGNLFTASVHIQLGVRLLSLHLHLVFPPQQERLILRWDCVSTEGGIIFTLSPSAHALLSPSNVSWLLVVTLCLPLPAHFLGYHLQGGVMLIFLFLPLSACRWLVTRGNTCVRGRNTVVTWLMRFIGWLLTRGNAGVGGRNGIETFLGRFTGWCGLETLLLGRDWHRVRYWNGYTGRGGGCLFRIQRML